MDRIIGKHQPITADIFLTTICNNACPYCTYKRHNGEISNKDYMSFENFVKYSQIIINEGVKGIILTGGGEPTLNPDFDKITNWLEKNNIPYGINTNFNIIKYFKPTYLKVSLDGFNEESYYQMRGVYTYKKVIQNIEEYSKWKKINSPNTKLGIQHLVKNPSEILNFYEAHKHLDIDYFNFRPNEDKNINYTPEEYELILQNLNYLKKIDNRVVINYKWMYLNDNKTQCLTHWSQIALNVNGDVLFCCHKPKEIIGHITDNDIMDKHFSAKVNKNTCDIPCRLSGPNNTMYNINNLHSDLEFI